MGEGWERFLRGLCPSSARSVLILLLQSVVFTFELEGGVAGAGSPLT